MNSPKLFFSTPIKGKKVLTYFIISSTVYALMLFVTIPKLIHFSNGMKILDMMPFGYSYQYVTQLFTDLGVDGRNFYLSYQIPIDMIYPFLLGLSNYYIIVYFLQKIDQWKTPFLYLSLLPFFGALFDYFENIGTIVMLNNFPNLNPVAVQINSFFTISKSFFISISFIALIVILVIFSIKKVSKNRFFTDFFDQL